MARLRYNGLTATLGAALTSSATSVTFGAALTHANGVAVPTIASPDYLPLSILDSSGNFSEIVYLTAYTSGATTGTITRAAEGAGAAVAHNSGDRVAHGPTAADINPGAWTPYTPTWAAASGTPSVGSTGTLAGAYQQFGNTVFFRLNFVLGGTGISTGTGTWNFTLPVAHIAPPSGIGQHGLLLGGYMEDAGVAAYVPVSGRLKSGSTTAFEILYSQDNGSFPGSGGVLGATAPFSWGTGDYLSIYGQYQTA